jgi:hypothetical protein
VVLSSSCERNSSFVHNKALNRLHSSCTEDLVFVYTNSRVFNQNVTCMDEATMEWYKQSIVSNDFDSNEPIDLFHEYDALLTLIHQPLIWTAYSPTIEIHEGIWKRRMRCKDFELEKMGGTSRNGLHAMQMHYILEYQ